MDYKKGDDKMTNIFSNENIKEGVEILAKLMKESKYTVLLTGAGMDTESNIPDFRGKDGLWKKYDPRLLASIDTFEENYSLFREFYSERIKKLKNVKPHEGHYILADFEKKGIIKSIATQNVSDLHGIAGSEKVYELHGNIRKIRCNHCNYMAELDDFLNSAKCTACGKDTLRPDVILFGEALPVNEWILAEEDIRKSDLIIVIGTSLEVYPVNQLPMLTRGKRVLINMEDVDIHYDFDLKLIGKAGEILKGLKEAYDSI